VKSEKETEQSVRNDFSGGALIHRVPRRALWRKRRRPFCWKVVGFCQMEYQEEALDFVNFSSVPYAHNKDNESVVLKFANKTKIPHSVSP
jgi:hypothetical protein